MTLISIQTLQTRIILNAKVDIYLSDTAQELLEQWVAEKIDLGGDDDDEDIWTRKTEAEIRREWDHLLDPDEDGYKVDSLDPTTTPLTNKGTDNIFISLLKPWCLR